MAEGAQVVKSKTIEDVLASIAPPRFDHACTRCSAATPRTGLCLECADEQRAARDAVLATRASIPKRFAWVPDLSAPTLSERVDQAALAHARALDLTRLDRVTLLGSAASGKSSLAVALASAWSAANALPAVFVAAADLGVARQQHGLGAGEAALVRQAMCAELTILDDLGVEPEVGAPVIAHLLHHRYDSQRPTIVTTGLAIEQLAKHYGAGVARRLLETAGGAVVLKLGGRRERSSP
jgi:DNA replication protein DnaC